MTTPIPVFYSPKMVATSRFFAPGTFKPGACVEDWQAHGLAIELREFEPASRASLALAHDPRYVDGILDGRLMNGFHGRQPDVAATLPYTTGAMMAAAEEACLNRVVACAPVSGFHHAHYDSAAGYCTFNGLVVTARHLLEYGYARRVGILDLDQHFGDGTEDIIQRLGLDRIEHYTAGLESRTPSDAEPFLRALPDLIRRRFARCQVLLYQAGADPHIDDPLGGWMNTEQLARRDRLVFEAAQEMGLPVAWNLAGGYQRDANDTIEPTLAIHRNTMSVCIEVVNAAGRAQN